MTASVWGTAAIIIVGKPTSMPPPFQAPGDTAADPSFKRTLACGRLHISRSVQAWHIRYAPGPYTDSLGTLVLFF